MKTKQTLTLWPLYKLRFHPPIFMRILEYGIKKLWMETGKMRINSKNVHKKLWMETGKMRMNSKKRA